ncbi:MAG: zinc ribbon domain-containing protein [Polyangiaceae bacterium]|nr:zinc ribbon domain-containing protein [Polyangiaceae bacterium]
MPVRVNDLLLRARPFTPLLLAAAVIGAALTRGLGLSLLVLAGGMLLYAIGSLWASVQSLGDDAALSLDEALALAAPSAEEEKKRSVLRALKDLEYERNVGKIGDADYLELSTRYREEARRLLRELNDAELPARARVEKLLARRLGGAAPPPPRRAPPESEAQGDDTELDSDTETAGDTELDSDTETAGDTESERAPEASGKPTCTECDTENDPDARFCKKCGEALG